MKLRRLEFRGFGCLVNQQYDFKDGINIVEASNESGKSTFIQGIHALWFGPVREDVKKRTRAEWLNLYKPWKTDEYMGSIEYQLRDHTYRIMRNLDFPKDREQIIHLEKGKDITQEYHMDATKKIRRFVEQQIQLSGEQLQRISFLTPTSLQIKKDKDSQVVERLKSLLGNGGGRDTSSAIQVLDQQIQEIGTIHSQKKEYGKTFKEYQGLKSECEKLEQDYERYMETKQYWRQKGEELASIQQELRFIQLQLQQAEQLSQLQNELDRILNKIENVTIQRRAILEKERKLNDQLTRRTELLQQIKELEPTHRVDEAAAQRLSYQLDQREKAQKKLKQFNEEQQQLASKFEQLKSHYEKVRSLEYTDFHRPMVQIEEYIRLEDEQSELMNRLGAVESSKGSILPWMIGMGLGVVALILSLFTFPLLSIIPLIWSVFATWKWRRITREEVSRKELRQEELIRLDKIKVRLLELRKEIEQWLQPYIETIPPFESLRWKKYLYDFQDRVLRTKEEFRSAANDLKNQSKNIETLQAEMVEWEQAIQHWLAHYQTLDLTMIYRWVEQTKEIQKLEEQLDLLQQVIEEDQKVKQQEGWMQRARELQEALGELEQQKVMIEGQLGEMDWNQELINIKNKKKHLDEKEKLIKEEYDRSEGSWRSLADRVERLPEMKGELAHLQEEIARLQLERNACTLARDFIQKATEDLQGHLAPQLQPHASRWIQTVTNGRYQELFIDPSKGFALRVTTPETGESQEIDRLSRGTIDQMIFALRLSLVQFFSQNTSPSIYLPLILDDCFVHFDEDRLREAIRALGVLGENHQILLCTCHTRERQILEDEGIPYHIIRMNRSI